MKGVTLLIPTYKGAATLAGTVKTWVESGLLGHPSLKRVVVRVNGCDCAQKATVASLFARSAAHLPLTILCSEANILHPRAMLALIAEVTTEAFLYTENDRPILRRTNEGIDAYKARVQSILNLAFDTVSADRPYIHLHRMLLGAQDEKMYRGWKEEGVIRHAMKLLGNRTKVSIPTYRMAGMVVRAEVKSEVLWGRSPGHAAEKSHLALLPVELTRPHQVEGDITPCWTYCIDIAEDWKTKALHEKSAVLDMCRHVAPLTPKDQHERCVFWACREWQQWVGSPMKETNFRNMMCWVPWSRYPGMPKWYQEERLVSYQSDPFLACVRSNHFVNAPAVYETEWYRRTVATTMCQSSRSRDKSGLTFNPRKKRYKHYGARMEQFMINNLAGNISCYTEGLTEHIEPEGYDMDRVQSEATNAPI